MIKIFSAHTTDFTQADYALQYSLLDIALREHIDRQKNTQDKTRSLAGYILLYRAVYQLFGKEKFKIYFNENGKPLCDFCYFNISHSDRCVVCAISDRPIGVDVQKIKGRSYREKYKFFNDKENAYVNKIDDLISLRYIEIFTKKESAVKMLGKTLSYASQVDTFSNEFIFDTKFAKEYVITICIKA
ncbi:MAG: 4'-phosphopantetheinyl transferase superfamily protein [Clostridia bacterium]|nr:4'-phosphopantetheinyl transferase superfamily protein [Clostridia bacterium]